MIVAPPGYGKSWLLAEWADHDARDFLWFSPGDVAAKDPEATLRALAARADARRAVVLVLDDAHLLAPDVLRDLVATALSELPDGSMVALGSRAEPPLPLARLRALRALVEVRAQDLAMTTAEASILLADAGVELDLIPLQGLVRRTEGWPAGLYLAAVSAREQSDVESALERLRGDDHVVAEYFRDEVLLALPPDLVEFAVKTSVLDELCGPVCDAVLERRGSGLALTALERATPLLRPLDPAHERHRWHGLFRDALQAELRRTAPESICALHARASAWYESLGDVDGAIDHASLARDPQRTGDLLWGSIVAYVTQGRNEMVQRWLARFTRNEIAEHAPLALSAAHSFLAAGNASESRHWALAAAAILERGLGEGGQPSLMAGLAGIDAMAAPAGVGDMAKAALRAYELEPLDSPWRPLGLFLRGAASHLTGEGAAAQRLLEEAVDVGAAAAPGVTSLALAQAAMIAIEQQDWDAATELTDRAARVLEERGLAEYPLSALVFAAIAATRAHQGRADEAKHDLRRGVELLTVLGDFIPWYAAETRILLAHASLGLADVVGARTLLAEASRLARRTPGAVIFEQWFEKAWAYIDELAETSLSGPSSLTIAELRILRFLPSHRSFREIAAQLGVSANTVKTQAHAVYRKLGAASRSEAVARAAEAGLLGQ